MCWSVYYLKTYEESLLFFINAGEIVKKIQID